MSFLRIVQDKSQLVGTAYVELLPGRYEGNCWNQGSIFLNEETFGFFERILAQNLPEYDHYSFTEVSSSRWKPIIARIKSFAAELRAARAPANLPRDICYFMNDTEQRFVQNFGPNVLRLQELSLELARWLDVKSKEREAVTILGL